jgi:hypothetical protein
VCRGSVFGSAKESGTANDGSSLHTKTDLCGGEDFAHQQHLARLLAQEEKRNHDASEQLNKRVLNEQSGTDTAGARKHSQAGTQGRHHAMLECSTLLWPMISGIISDETATQIKRRRQKPTTEGQHAKPDAKQRPKQNPQDEQSKLPAEVPTESERPARPIRGMEYNTW